MSNDELNNGLDDNQAPKVSKISLDLLKETKKSIAPIYSKSEEEALLGVSQEEIDKYNDRQEKLTNLDPKKIEEIQNKAEMSNTEKKDEKTNLAEENVQDETSDSVSQTNINNNFQSVEESGENSNNLQVAKEKESVEQDNREVKTATEDNQKTQKIPLQELNSIKLSFRRDENGNIIRETNEENQSVEDDSVGGEFKKDLDFENINDIKKFKLPANKKPIIITICSLLFVIVLAVVLVAVIGNKKNQIYVTGYELSTNTIIGGFVGDRLDLSNVQIIEKYSNGTYSRISNVRQYISSVRNGISNDLNLTKATEAGLIMFNMEGLDKPLQLTVIVKDKKPTGIEEFLLTSNSIDLNPIHTINFSDMLIKVRCGEYGLKLLTKDDISSKVQLFCEGVEMAKTLTDDGGYFTIAFTDDGKAILAKNNNKIIVKYTDMNTSVELEVNVEIN